MIFFESMPSSGVLNTYKYHLTLSLLIYSICPQYSTWTPSSPSIFSVYFSPCHLACLHVLFPLVHVKLFFLTIDIFFLLYMSISLLVVHPLYMSQHFSASSVLTCLFSSLITSPFLIGPEVSPSRLDSTRMSLTFSLSATTPASNLCRLLRALQLPRRALLLEGSPGVGKTSLVAALARASGHRVIRINLSEATVSYLFNPFSCLSFNLVTPVFYSVYSLQPSLSIQS